MKSYVAFIFATALGFGTIPLNAETTPPPPNPTTSLSTNVTANSSGSSSGSSFSFTSTGPPFMNVVSDFIDTEAYLLQTLYGSQYLEAQGDRLRAQAARQWQVNNRLSILNIALKAEFEVLRREQRRAMQCLFAIGKSRLTLDHLKLGQLNPTLLKTLDYLKEQLLSSKILEDLVFRKIPRFGRENFSPNRRSTTAEDFIGGTSEDFFAFLKKKDYSLAFGSPAHLEILRMLEVYYHAMGQKTVALILEIEEKRKEAYQRWQVVIPKLKTENTPAVGR